MLGYAVFAKMTMLAGFMVYMMFGAYQEYKNVLMDEKINSMLGRY